jgi:parallel beta-helix repeat protein
MQLSNRPSAGRGLALQGFSSLRGWDRKREDQKLKEIRPVAGRNRMEILRSLDIFKIFILILAAVLVLVVEPLALESLDEGWAATGGCGGHVMDAGILLIQSDNNSITGNSVMGNRIGICLLGSNNNAVAENYIDNSREYGLFLDSSSGNGILRNRVNRNAFGGISLWDSSDNCLLYNEASRNPENGISLWDSLENSLLNNNASFNGRWGIYLLRSHENYILANNASHNGENGLIFCESDANALGANVATNNLGVCGDICSYDSSSNFVLSRNVSRAALSCPQIHRF